MKNFSRVKQLTGSYCGPAVFEMLVGDLDLPLDQEKMVDAAGARKTVMKTGTSLDDLVKGLKQIYPDLTVWAKRESKVEDLETLTKKGYPVAINWQGIFNSDEYGDDEIDTWGEWRNNLVKGPVLKGEQGHYCVALEVDKKKGDLRFADPYGHYAGKDRFVAIWEFEERWWDDRIGIDEQGKKEYVLEKRLMFLVTKKSDTLPGKLGMAIVK